MSRLLSALFIAGVRRSSTKVAHSFKSKVSHGIYTRQYSAFGTHNRRTSCNICQLTGLVERALCTTDIAMNALQKRKMQTSSLLEGPQNEIHSQSSLEVSRVYEASNRENHSSKEENSLPLGPITSVSKEPNYESQDISQLQSVLDEQAEGYRKHFISLLQSELDEESRRNEERQSEWSLDQLVDEGYTILGLSAYRYVKPSQKFHDGFIFDFVPSAGEILNNSLLVGGVQVTIKEDSELDSDEKYTGTIIFSSLSKIRVKFHTAFSGFRSKVQWRIDLGVTDITHIRMRRALEAMRVDPTVGKTESTRDSVQGTYLRDVLLHGWESKRKMGAIPLEKSSIACSPLTSNHSIQDWARRYSSENPVRKESDPKIPLNPSQIRAIAQMLCKRISLVQGPPGTGKTRTIVEALKLLKDHFKVEYPILVCTYTNPAVDHLVDTIASVNLKPLRVGNEGKIREDLEMWSIQAQRENHPKWNKYVELTLERERLYRSIRKQEKLGLQPESSEKSLQAVQSDSFIDNLKARLKSIKHSIRTLFKEIDHDLLRRTDVICTTCISAGSSTFDVMEFPIVFIDEASMSTEPACLIPLMRGSQHLALIGDHKQLPPVITSIDAQKGGLSQSLFERLIENEACDSIMLNTQYRMHPDISAFPIREFYGEKLKDGTDLKEMKPTTFHRLLGSKFGTSGQLPPVLFIDHDNPESICGRSRANYDEMRIIAAVIQDLLLYNQDIKGEDIGIISPYVAQVRSLTQMLRSNSSWEQLYKDILGEKRAAEIKKIEIKTVDGFEGREKEYIIFSTVRNNWYGGIGFLADKRRMNVALTRAKRALFVLGSLTTLSGGKHGFAGADQVAKMMIKGTGEEWKKFAQFVIARNLFIEYGRPAEYRSAEEMQEFEKLAGIPTILEDNMNTTALI